MFKPQSLCRAPERVFSFYRKGISDADFFGQLKFDQLERLTSMQMRCRLATIEDIPRIEQLVFSRYSPEVAGEISPFDTYRYVRFGQVLVVENLAGDTLACAYEVGYDHPERPSYLMRLVVREDMESRGLATILNRLASAMAFERGARSRHALLDPANQKSLYVHLNKVGSYFRDVVDVTCPGIENHFVSARPLSARTLAENSIDDQALLALCTSGHLPAGWRLVDAQDLGTLRQLLRVHSLGVVAALPRSGSTPSDSGQRLLLTPLQT